MAGAILFYEASDLDGISLWWFLHTGGHVTYDLTFSLGLLKDLIAMIAAWATCVTSGVVVS
jgi:hypothetical protein